ncbi:MAG: N-acetyltransferase [Chloroflexi bacterium]|nr:N-acetyltransferase [Chloroflexota bacterium]
MTNAPMMTNALQVRPVRSEADRQAFLRFPWAVYQDDPNWVGPLWKEHVEFFDVESNPELKHMTRDWFVAWRGNQPVGTIHAHVNHLYNDYHNANAGWFGQFEVFNDAEAGSGLLSAAESWLREQGVEEIIGPATFSTGSEIGLLIDGFDEMPMILIPYAKPYYKEFVEAHGFEKAIDFWAWYLDSHQWGGQELDQLPEKIVRITEKLRQRRGVTLRRPNMRRVQEEFDLVRDLYNQSWEKNWGFVPLTEEQIDKLAETVVSVMDPHISFWIEREGEPVGFLLPLPNLYEPMKKARFKPGEPHWWQLLRLLWHWRIAGRVTSLRVFALGILPEHRGAGLDALAYTELIRAGVPRGYRDVEMSQILANNDMMNRAIERLGARVYKTHRVYLKKLT